VEIKGEKMNLKAALFREVNGLFPELNISMDEIAEDSSNATFERDIKDSTVAFEYEEGAGYFASVYSRSGQDFYSGDDFLGSLPESFRTKMIMAGLYPTDRPSIASYAFKPSFLSKEINFSLKNRTVSGNRSFSVA
jgi:hypothetical protein